MKIDYLESFPLQQLRQGFLAPEFNVPTIPQGRVMVVPFIEKTQGQVLEVTMIGRGQNQQPTRFENLLREARQ
jgi:hypothetical protein